ncbi:hypothetical protein GIB67_018091 [Kingdonia uniflora]|uniref:Late embryogenesis abundant protein LEA-2 subgroup domain-containing protein n=1 Tax=Kingdonia uniflora TaxID=39325 RepID=A0A7J7NWJ3_9MAGN|nr:hypothetical protein GIB67_018091 [Kingdonia uniflora]
MEGQSMPARSTKSGRPRLLQMICIFIVALIVLVGLAVLIFWLAVRPKRLIYTIEDAKVYGFGLHKNSLNASFDFVVRAYNPNRRMSVYYDSMDVSVAYGDEKIAFSPVEPFYQPRHNVTKLEVKPVAHNFALLGAVASDMRHEKGTGEIEVTIRMRARIRYKVGVVKSAHYKLRVVCKRVEVSLNSSRGFNRAYCNVHT